MLCGEPPWGCLPGLWESWGGSTLGWTRRNGPWVPSGGGVGRLGLAFAMIALPMASVVWKCGALQQEGDGRKFCFLPTGCSGVGPGAQGSLSKQKLSSASVGRAGVSSAQNWAATALVFWRWFPKQDTLPRKHSLGGGGAGEGGGPARPWPSSPRRTVFFVYNRKRRILKSIWVNCENITMFCWFMTA